MQIEALAANVAKLGPKDQQFAQSLLQQHKAGKKPLSEKQAFWVDKLAERAAAPAKPAAETVTLGNTFAGVLALFAVATGNGMKQPRIRLMLEDGTDVAMNLAGAHTSNPGFVYIKIGGEYRGKVSPTAVFTPVKLPEGEKAQLLDLLDALVKDPAGTAALYGKATGNCCFCSQGLTDERSLFVGYGPVCAEHYSLPWGEAH